MKRILLMISQRDGESGRMPTIPPGAYVGYFDSAGRRLIFVCDQANKQTHLYFSSEGWNRAFAMRDGRLPGEIVLNSQEAAWAMACWKAAWTGCEQ